MKDYLIGIDIGGTFIKASLIDPAAEPVGTLVKEPTHSAESAEMIRASLQKVLSVLKKDAEERGGRITGVAADIPGPFDYKNGICLMKHKFVSLYGMNILPWFYEILGNVRVVLLHDSHSFLLGCGMPDRTCAGVMLGTGLGFALMKEGTVLVTEEGRPQVSIYMRPFRDGTAEDYVSARGVTAAYLRNGGTEPKDAKEVGMLASAGDEAAVKAYEDIGAHLGEIIAPVLTEHGVVNLYLGGQISRSYNAFGAALREKLAGCSGLREIVPVRDIDLVHLKGAVKYYLAGGTVNN